MAPAANGQPIQRRDPERDEEDDIGHEEPSENSPLLPSEDAPNADQSQPQRERTAESLLRSLSYGSGKGSWRKRWPSLIALLILCLLVLIIIIFAFFAPGVIEQYAMQAVDFKPTSLSIEAFTSSGVRARIQGDFSMDASRVQKKSVRDLGRFGTWIAREVESGESEVEVSLPEYGNVVLGTAQVPSIWVDVRDGHTTHVDLLSDLQPGDVAGIRKIANDWIEGRLGQLRVVGKARVPVRSGILSFGEQTLRHELLFENKGMPRIPGYDIRKVNVHEVDSGMAADVSLAVSNDYPVEFTVPSLGFQILVEGCRKSDPYIMVADAVTQELHIHPEEAVEVNVTGLVRQLPDLITHDCPDSELSPLDVMLGKYMRGKENTIHVRGSESPSTYTPKWLEELMSDIVVPVPLPGKESGDLIKNFTLADTHFDLPDPFADHRQPESNPRISAKVKALIALPEEMNFNISANSVRADAEVFYKGGKLGNLDLRKWQPANSTRHEATKDEGPTLLVEALIKQAPLEITDSDVFTSVIQDLMFGDKNVMMHIKADVSVQVETALGELKVRNIPAEGQVPVKPISGGRGHGGNGTIGSSFKPKIGDLRIIDTTESSLTLSVLLNLTNPTDYSASIPYIDIHIMKNASILGHATARDIYVQPGENHNLYITAVYDPLTLGGKPAKATGRELLSQYISGWNTTLSLAMHASSLPTQPLLGKALSKFPIEIPTPKLSSPSPPNPDDPDDGSHREGPHFIEDATMHLLTSTATFTLLSPLRHSTLYLETIDATAFYHNDSVGHIFYAEPFAVPPVDKDGNGVQTPRMPVEWSLESVGFEAVKNALGGTLRLSAEAEVGIRLGKWREGFWFRGGSIGAKVRI